MSEPSPPAPPVPWGTRLRGWAIEGLKIGALLVAGLVIFGWLRSPSLPDEAPDFTLATVKGDPITLSDLRGQTVIVNFWATWCGPCLAELPTLQAFARARPDVTLIGVAIDEPAATRRRTQLSGLTYPIALGDHAVSRAYGVTSFPTTVVVDPQGRIVTAHTGMALRPQLELWRLWANWRG